MVALKRFGSVAAVLGLAAIGSFAMPHQANAWWRGGIWIPPVVVAPAYVPPPVVYAPPPAYYGYGPGYYAPGYYAPAARVWIAPHWEGGYWIRGHWR
jgi:hypothetical protein